MLFLYNKLIINEHLSPDLDNMTFYFLCIITLFLHLFQVLLLFETFDGTQGYYLKLCVLMKNRGDFAINSNGKIFRNMAFEQVKKNVTMSKPGLGL